MIGVVADEMQLGSAQEKVYEYADAHANHQRVRQIAAEVLTQFVRAKTLPELVESTSWLRTLSRGLFPKATRAAAVKRRVHVSAARSARARRRRSAGRGARPS